MMTSTQIEEGYNAFFNIAFGKKTMLNTNSVISPHEQNNFEISTALNVQKDKLNVGLSSIWLRN